MSEDYRNLQGHNAYDLLEVPQDATQEEIKRAYRQQARKYHPDMASEPEATEMFTLCEAAYGILSHPEQRARYDAHLRRRSEDAGSANDSEPEEAPPYSDPWDSSAPGWREPEPSPPPPPPPSASPPPPPPPFSAPPPPPPPSFAPPPPPSPHFAPQPPPSYPTGHMPPVPPFPAGNMPPPPGHMPPPPVKPHYRLPLLGKIFLAVLFLFFLMAFIDMFTASAQTVPTSKGAPDMRPGSHYSTTAQTISSPGEGGVRVEPHHRNISSPVNFNGR